MKRFFKRSSKKKGLPSGRTTGGKLNGQIYTTVFRYNADNLWETETTSLEGLELFKQGEITWINITGVHQANFIDEVRKHFDLHPLILEDIVDTEQRIKVEDYDDYLFVVLKMLKYNPGDEEIGTGQVSLIIKDNHVITFQEVEGDVFDSVRERIRQNKGLVRRHQADYLMYTLIDAIVDNYFVVMKHITEEIDMLEEELLAEANKQTLERIHAFKSHILLLRRIVLPLRDVLNELGREGQGIISRKTAVYLRDIYDHTIRIMDKLDYFRELMNSLLDIYLSMSSNKMNEVMKILTIIATIFMPLTLISGVYGMNFKYMPELEKTWGYPAVLLVMLVIAVLMLIYFKRKKML